MLRLLDTSEYISLVDFLKAARASLSIYSSKAAAILDGGFLHLYTNKSGSRKESFANFTKLERIGLVQKTRVLSQEYFINR